MHSRCGGDEKLLPKTTILASNESLKRCNDVEFGKGMTRQLIRRHELVCRQSVLPPR